MLLGNNLWLASVVTNQWASVSNTVVCVLGVGGCVYMQIEKQVRFVHDKKLINAQTGHKISKGTDKMSVRAKVKGSASACSYDIRFDIHLNK